MQQIPDIVSAYGLGHLYRGHTLHGDFPLFDLHGFLRMDQLLERPMFTAYAEAEGMPAELWGGEVLQVRTSPSLVIDVEHTDNCLVGLVRGYIGAAGRAMQPKEGQPNWVPSWNEAMFQQVEIVSVPQVPLNEMSMEERLDRARALRGKWVAEPLHPCDLIGEKERERVLNRWPELRNVAAEPVELTPEEEELYAWLDENAADYAFAMEEIRQSRLLNGWDGSEPV